MPSDLIRVSCNDGGGSWNDMICDKNDPHDYAKTQIIYSLAQTGIAGTRVAGDLFAIDCNNNRNF